MPDLGLDTFHSCERSSRQCTEISYFVVPPCFPGIDRSLCIIMYYYVVVVTLLLQYGVHAYGVQGWLVLSKRIVTPDYYFVQG